MSSVPHAMLADEEILPIVMTQPSSLLPVFSKALAAFHSSNTPFRLVCSLRGRVNDTSPATAAAAVAAAPSVPTVVVLDSSFNPPTLAHMRMAKSALGATPEPRRILLLLATNNADKEAKPAAFPHRLAMMLEFARDLQEGEIGDGGGMGVTVDVGLTTQAYFSSKAEAVEESGIYARHGEVESQPPRKERLQQVYLAGFDTVIRIFNPKYYPATPSLPPDTTPMQAALDPFFARSRLRVTARPDDKWGDFPEQQAHLKNLAAGALDKVGGRARWAADRVEMVEGRKPDEEPVSSTRIRQACETGKIDTLKRLASPRVYRWIREKHLYGLN